MIRRSKNTGGRIAVPQDMGAAARRIYVQDRINIGSSEHYIKPGSNITGVKVMATGEEIREVDRLVATYKLQHGESTSPKDWTKMRGTAIIVRDGKEDWRGEVHWYQAPNIGKVEWKVKRWLEETKNK